MLLKALLSNSKGLGRALKECYAQTKLNNSYLACRYKHTLFTSVGHERGIVEKSARKCHQQTKEVECEEDDIKYSKKEVLYNSEATWHHKKITSLPGYSEILVTPPLVNEVSTELGEQLLQSDWRTMSTKELVDNFKVLTSYIYSSVEDIENTNYESILSDIGNRLFQLSFSEFETILIHYQLMRKFNKHPASHCFLKAVDNYIHNKTPDLNLEEKLKMCDLLHMAGITRYCPHFYKLMKMLSCKTKQMSQQQLVHYSFLLATNSHCKQVMFELEHYVQKYLPTMSIHELSVIALCFFKRKYQVRTKLFFSIILENCLRQIDDMESYHVSAFMKYCRSFRNREQCVNLQNLVQALEKKLDKFDLPCLTHLAHAAANNSIYEKSLMDKIVDRFTNNIEEARLKDFERMAFSLSIYYYNPKHPLFRTITKQLHNPPHRKNEIKLFSKVIPISCMFMGKSGYYNLPLLEQIMDSSFYTPLYKSLMYNMNLEYLWLDQSIEIEVPNYTGPRIKKEVIAKLKKFYQKQNELVKNSSRFSSIVFNIFNEFENLLRPGAVHLTHILPHYIKPDLVIALDKFNKTLPVKEILQGDQIIQHIPEEYKADNKWFAIIIGNDYSVLSGTYEPTGYYMSKMRQLERLGYIPLMISISQWEKAIGRQSFLGSLLFDESNRTKFNNELFIDTDKLT